MSHATRTGLVRRSLAAASGAVVLLVCPLALSADAPRVVVRVYAATAADSGTRTDAIRVAAAILSRAGLGAEWRDCHRETGRPTCDPSRAPGDLIIRVVPTAGERRAGPGHAATARPVASDDLTLGVAVLDATGTGVLGTIYFDRVQQVARLAGIDATVLLGRVIAHEVGHLTLHGSGHRETGLMRAVWTGTELAMNRTGDWLVDPSK